jgi:hypothetical protein
VLEKEVMPCVAVQDDFRVGQPLVRGVVAPERVDHDVVGTVCLLPSSVLVMECFHAGLGPTLCQARPTFDRVHRTNDMHARGRVALEGGIRIIGVVDDAWHDHRRRAVL